MDPDGLHARHERPGRTGRTAGRRPGPRGEDGEARVVQAERHGHQEHQAPLDGRQPGNQRGAGAGILNTFNNSASVLSIGVFFTIITLGLGSRLPSALFNGLTAHGVPDAQAHQVAQLPPIGSLLSAFLGFNPVHQLLGSASQAHISPDQYVFLTGRGFFPSIIRVPSATACTSHSSWPRS